MSNDLFPSGPWIGFYNYHPGDRHRMDLQLVFINGSMTGDGVDDVGRFLIRGRYDSNHKECYWTKSYVGAHDVFYRGFREGKGIWGTWEIASFARGGFHIWPRQAGEGGQEASAVKTEKPVDAIASEALTKPAVDSAGYRKGLQVRDGLSCHGFTQSYLDTCSCTRFLFYETHESSLVSQHLRHGSRGAGRRDCPHKQCVGRSGRIRQ